MIPAQRVWSRTIGDSCRYRMIDSHCSLLEVLHGATPFNGSDRQMHNSWCVVWQRFDVVMLWLFTVCILYSDDTHDFVNMSKE